MIVDDQEMIRVGLRTIINSHPALTVVADVANGLDALHTLETTAVDVVLIDIRMPGIDGVETTRRIREKHAPEELRILVLTTFEHDENVLAVLRSGANGFLGKGIGPAALTAQVIEVAAGGGALSAVAAARLIEHVTDDQPEDQDAALAAKFKLLTARELEVVIAIVGGLGNQDIADRWFVSPFTVKTHANRAMAKVGARDRAQLVSFAFRAGMRPNQRS
jgi:DNA-binding NarL/FixJ family response regulator